MKRIYLSAALLTAFLAPVAAQAADGVATANVNMRSGPSTRYPAVVVIPYGARVNIHGCLQDRPWCDVSFPGGRGWVAGQYVQTVYKRQRVYVAPQYYRPLGIPTITFDVDNYWGRNYRHRDFYRERDYWRGERARDSIFDAPPPRRDRFDPDRPRDPRRDRVEDGMGFDRPPPPRREDGRPRDRDRFDNQDGNRPDGNWRDGNRPDRNRPDPERIRDRERMYGDRPDRGRPPGGDDFGNRDQRPDREFRRGNDPRDMNRDNRNCAPGEENCF